MVLVGWLSYISGLLVSDVGTIPQCHEPYSWAIVPGVISFFLFTAFFAFLAGRDSK